MNIALITAAGIGARMNNDLPKQFVHVAGVPIIIHTLRAFQNHPDIDAICVVCLGQWCDKLAQYAREFGISKLRHIVIGGPTGQDSILRGLNHLQQIYSSDDVVLIHDGVRPMVSQKMITECIATTIECGCAIASIPCAEAILQTTDGGKSSIEFTPREQLRRTQTPHGFYLGDIAAAYDMAAGRGIRNAVAGCTLMIALGRRVFFYDGDVRNFKITTPADLDMFIALCAVDGDMC